MFRIEHNVETGIITEIPLTKQEIDAINKEAQLETERINALIAERKTKQDELDAPKINILSKLGLSADEVAALLG
jgi:hypothetical protein